MTAFRSLFVACLALSAASCAPSGRPLPQVDAQGRLGSTSSGSSEGTFSIDSPYSQRGDRLTIQLESQSPGVAEHAAVLLLIKAASPSHFSTGGGTDGSSERSSWHQNLPTVSGKPFALRYELDHMPVAERMILGDQVYELENGAVFLIDLSQQPVKVTQVKAELPKFAENRETSRGDLEAAVAALRKQHPPVEAFLAEKR